LQITFCYSEAFNDSTPQRFIPFLSEYNRAAGICGEPLHGAHQPFGLFPVGGQVAIRASLDAPVAPVTGFLIIQ